MDRGGWYETHIYIYSCYWSSDSTFAEYQDFLSRLETSIRGAVYDILIIGDLNAHYSDWGSKSNCRRGDALSDVVNTVGLLVYNQDRKLTFEKSTIIDVTFATLRLATKIKD